VITDHDRLRSFWNSRYARFSLSESGCLGAGDGLNERLYQCKAQALTRSLDALGLDAQRAFAVLDAGCGQGYFARLYRERYPQASYVGLDISERAVTHLRGAIPGAEFHVADLGAWADPAGRRFDVVQSVDVLYLILDDEHMSAAMANLALHVKPGGALLITEVLPEETRQPNDYVRYRSRRFWQDLLARLGLRIAAERPMYYWLPAGGPANKYLRYALTHAGPGALYALDRAALAAGLPRPPSLSMDCGIRLLTITRS
jgi:SAM-dependent methyltransferase